MNNYTIWLEFEHWLPGIWNPADANTDVIVNFEDGSRYVATFLTYKNMDSLVEKNRETREYFSGKCLWVSDMVLADEISRTNIEAIVQYLIEEEEFEFAFKQIPPEENYED